MSANPICIDIEDRNGLRQCFSTLGKTVGPRVGPKRRTAEDREWFCLREYLLSLDSIELINYPMRICKSESPDFVIENIDQQTGIEVTEATEEHFQQELTKDERRGGDDVVFVYGEDGCVGFNAEEEWCEIIIKQISSKLKKVKSYDFPIGRIGILVYASPRSIYLVSEPPVAMLRESIENNPMLWQECCELNWISIISRKYLLIDVISKGRLIRIPN